MKETTLVKRIFMIFWMLLVAACSSQQATNEIPESINHGLLKEFRIGVGDQIQVSVWRNAELSVSVPVRPDGKISAPLVGDVEAAGKTSVELSEILTQALSDYIRSPQVTVIVTNPVSAAYLQRIRITGAVNAPMSVNFSRGITVLDLVLEAGGLTPFAVGNETLLYRKTAEGIKVYTVYVDDILTKGSLDTNYELMPTDILTIPESSF